MVKSIKNFFNKPISNRSFSIVLIYAILNLVNFYKISYWLFHILYVKLYLGYKNI